MVTGSINGISAILLKKLLWLDNAYGRAYRLVDGDNNIYPAAHASNNEYISLLPSDMLGNYLFFELEDPHQIIAYSQERHVSRFRANLIVWFNLADIYGDITDKIQSDDIKEEILKALAYRFHPGVTIEVVEIYENAENIYKRYSLKQVDTQFLMLPYYGFKFVLNITERKIC